MFKNPRAACGEEFASERHEQMKRLFGKFGMTYNDLREYLTLAYLDAS
jgi:hypothetical protein